MFRCRAAATAEDVDEAGLREVAEESCCVGRRFVVLTKRVREAGVRIGGHIALGDAGELCQVWPHLLGTERAVQPDTEGLGVADGSVEGVERLARERAAAPVGDRHRDHQRQFHTTLVEDLEHRGDRCLRVQGIEDRL